MRVPAAITGEFHRLGTAVREKRMTVEQALKEIAQICVDRHEHFGLELAPIVVPSAELATSDVDAPALFDAYRAYSDVDWKMYEKVEAIFGKDTIADIGHDAYDASLEIYADADIAPTPEQAAAVIAMGFSRFWINFRDETEIFVYGTSINQRRKRSYSKWVNSGKRCAPSASTATSGALGEFVRTMAREYGPEAGEAAATAGRAILEEAAELCDGAGGDAGRAAGPKLAARIRRIASADRGNDHG